MTPRPNPHVIILYALDGELRPVLATPSAVDAWRFQLLDAQPESGLAALKTEAQKAGALVVDTSAPVIISYRIPLWHALKAVDRVNRSMVIAAARRASETERRLYR